MLRSTSAIMGYVLNAQDGEIGRCNDFLFDDRQWTIRYMVADTAKWLPGRRVLISPISIGQPDWSLKQFPVELTKEEVRRSPEIDEDAPVSRQFELRFYRHHQWTPYWTFGGIWGNGAYPRGLAQRPTEASDEWSRGDWDSHLRSCKEVTGYSIGANDGEIGHVEDFVVDDEMWVIRYMVIDTRNWLPGKKVLVSPDWIQSVGWADEKVHVNLSKDQIKDSPGFDPAHPVNRQYEELLYDYYGRPAYWTSSMLEDVV